MDNQESVDDEVPSVPSEDKQFDSSTQDVHILGEVAGFANETLEIMTQFGIHAFHTTGFTFVWHGIMGSRRVEQGFVR